jgi:transcriptional regulator with PAS, ATPase and Fis domain
MYALWALAARVAPVDSTVLITGESGVGKDWVAQWLHASSPRAQAPFEPVNCAALPETLFETALFGHARGAFTGAAADQPGLFEAANGGTLLPRRDRGGVTDHAGEALAGDSGTRTASRG